MTQSTAVGGRCQAICGAREGGERFRGREKKRPRCDGEAKKRGRVQGGLSEFLTHMVNKMLTMRNILLCDLADSPPGRHDGRANDRVPPLISTLFGIR